MLRSKRRRRMIVVTGTWTCRLGRTRRNPPPRKSREIFPRRSYRETCRPVSVRNVGLLSFESAPRAIFVMLLCQSNYTIVKMSTCMTGLQGQHHRHYHHHHHQQDIVDHTTCMMDPQGHQGCELWFSWSWSWCCLACRPSRSLRWKIGKKVIFNKNNQWSYKSMIIDDCLYKVWQR